jgi:hypothetical protein
MAQQLDVYRDWLRITETARPLNYYQLLRMPAFEDDVGKIRSVYRKMNVHVRKFASGDFAAESQALLNELAKAMLCLTDAERKREYDATLGRKDAGPGRRRTLEEILLANKVIDQEQLTKARSFADAVGLSVRDALVQQKMAGPDVVMMSYAESVGLPYVELEDIGVDEQLVRSVPSSIARQHSCVPVMIDDNQLLMASPNALVPDVEEELRLRFGMPVRSVLCTPASVNQAIGKHYPRDMAGVAPVAPLKKPAAGQTGKPARPAQPQAEAAGDALSAKERTKLQSMVGVALFALTVFLTLASKMMFFKAPHNKATFLTFLAAAGIGLVVGGIGFVAAKSLKVKV